MSTEHSWGSEESGEYLLSYADGRSDAWEETMAAQGREHVGNEPCLESAWWALRPIDALQSAFPGGPHAGWQTRLESFIREEVQRDRCLILSGLATTATPMGSWQCVYILAEVRFLPTDRDGDALLAKIRQLTPSLAPARSPQSPGTPSTFLTPYSRTESSLIA